MDYYIIQAQFSNSVAILFSWNTKLTSWLKHLRIIFFDLINDIICLQQVYIVSLPYAKAIYMLVTDKYYRSQASAVIDKIPLI